MNSKRILLTGGSKGIGEAFVRLARQKGHEVVFTGRDAARTEAVARDTGAHGILANVADPADNARTVEETIARIGGIDVLVNNAAFGYGALIGEMDVERMKAMFDVNVFGLVDLANRVVPLMKQQDGGDIINVASTSGLKGGPGGTSYSGSKWALRGITQCWQAELRPHNIRVFCVCPSEVQTGWNGGEKGSNPKKLFGEDIAYLMMAMLELETRGFVPEFPVFATNPF